MESITDKLRKFTSWPTIESELSLSGLVDTMTKQTLSGYGRWLWNELLFQRAGEHNIKEDFLSEVASNPNLEKTIRQRNVARMHIRYYSFGQAVTEIRGILGVDKKTLAIVAGTDEPMIDRVEKSNTSPSLHLTAEICLAFAVIEQSITLKNNRDNAKKVVDSVSSQDEVVENQIAAHAATGVRKPRKAK